MDFDSAIAEINKKLMKKQPATFNRSWIRIHAPRAYRFIQKKVRVENGGIDWDRITRRLDFKFQRLWTGSVRKTIKPAYRNKKEVDTVLQRYSDKLYTFLAPADKDDEHLRDMISISLVRIAQKGNMSARQEVIKLLTFTLDEWIDRYPTLACWRGYDPLILTQLECCIRRYRYSGSFMRYLFKTLEYAGRGLRPLIAFSLDAAHSH
jgi:hypothetical protein